MNIILATGNHNKIREFKAILQEQCIQDSINVYAYSDFITPFEIEEGGSSFEENAAIKLRAVYEAFITKARDDKGFYATLCTLLQDSATFIAEDSGLCIPALDDEPGIYSARYCEYIQSKEGHLDKCPSNSTDEENLHCLIQKLSLLAQSAGTQHSAFQTPAYFIAHIAMARIAPLESCRDSASSYLSLYSPLPQDVRIEHFEGVLQGCVQNEKRGIHGFGYDPIFIPYESNPNKQTLAEFSLSAKNSLSHRKKAISKCIAKLFDI